RDSTMPRQQKRLDHPPVGDQRSRLSPTETARLAAEELGCLTFDRLLDGVEPHELMAAEIYPLGWEDRSSLEWGGDWFAGLAQYFAAAAQAEHAVIVWLD
ncbi:DUF1877 family protein, partial [Streptomyces sp. NPDC005148]